MGWQRDMDGYPSSRVEHQCCFCGRGIQVGRVDPILVTIVLEDDAEQDLYCHLRCLRARLHSSVPLALPQTGED